MSNLILTNPGFETGDLTGWQYYDLGTIGIGTIPKSGTYNASLDASNPGTGGIELTDANRASVIAGKNYYFSIWVFVPTAPPAESIKVWAEYYDSGGSVLSTELVAIGIIGVTILYNQLSGKALAPTGAVTARLRVTIQDTDGRIWLDDAEIYPVNPIITGIDTITGVDAITF
jgi:hypothetical protein